MPPTPPHPVPTTHAPLPCMSPCHTWPPSPCTPPTLHASLPHMPPPHTHPATHPLPHMPAPWTEWLTDRCKNIAFPQLRLREVMKQTFYQCIAVLITFKTCAWSEVFNEITPDPTHRRLHIPFSHVSESGINKKSWGFSEVCIQPLLGIKAIAFADLTLTSLLPLWRPIIQNGFLGVSRHRIDNSWVFQKADP